MKEYIKVGLIQAFIVLLPVLIWYFILLPVTAESFESRLTSVEDHLTDSIGRLNELEAYSKTENAIIRSDIFDIDSRVSRAEVRECKGNGGQVTPFLNGVECVVGGLQNDYVIKYDEN